MKQIKILLCIWIIAYAGTLYAASDVPTITAALYQTLEHADSFEQFKQIYDTLCKHPDIPQKDCSDITAHALARAYQQLVICTKKGIVIAKQTSQAQLALGLSGYLLCGIIANRFFNVGINKPWAWIWFPMARACSLDETNKQLMDIGLGIFWAQFLASPCIALYGIPWGISKIRAAEYIHQKNSRKIASLKRIIIYLEGVYYKHQPYSY